MDSDAENNAEAREAQVRLHAYRLWLEEGQPEGRADEHWRLATEAADQAEAREAFLETDAPARKLVP